MPLKTLRAACLVLTLAAPWPAPAQTPALIVIDAKGKPTPIGPSDLALLPSVHMVVPSTHGPAGTTVAYDGPSLWSVLTRFAAVADASRQNAGQAVRVEGADKYDAVLAMGEIAPGLEAKQVILADHQNGQPLPTGHLHLVVPADQHASRNVRDVTCIAVLTP